LFAWDSESGKEFLTDVRFSHGTDNFHIDTVSVISKFPYYYDTLRINLLAGWNLTSTYIAPLNLSMSSIFSEIGSDIVIVKNSSGQVYIPLYNINTIGNWNISQGYQIYANKNTTLKIIGETVNPKLIEISLNAGWNLISYLRNTPMNPATALEYLFQNSRLVIVKNSAGQVYIPSYNINTIGNLLPSFGYQLYLTSPDTLIYPGN